VTAGTVISPPIAVQLTGPPGGVVSDRDIRLTLRGPAGASLDGDAVLRTSNGVATFSQLSIDRAGTGYRLVASAADALPAESGPFDVRPGPAAVLVFTRQPGAGAEHGALSRQPQVSMQDRYGNTTRNAVRITLGIAPRGASSGRLTCDGGNSRLASDGVVSFTGCRIDRAGEGYRLIATADQLRAALSQPFDIQRPGAGGSWWPLAAGAAVILLLVTVTAGLRQARRHRAVHPGERTHAEPHSDVGTVEVVSEQGAHTHAIRLEPHADRGTAHLEEQP